MITRDPLPGVNGTTTVANPYHYTDNNPLNHTDPTGLHPGLTNDTDFGSGFASSGGVGSGAHFATNFRGGPGGEARFGAGDPAGGSAAPSQDDWTYILTQCINDTDHQHCERGKDQGTLQLIQETAFALTEVYTDFYASGFMIYWSRNATRFLKQHERDLSAEVLYGVTILGGVMALVAPPPADAVIALLTISIDANWFFMQGAVDNAAANNSCVVLPLRHWDVPSGFALIPHSWGASSDFPDADKCADSYV